MRMIRSGMLVLGANLADSAAVLLRNVILARLLSVGDFGVAATFSILMTLMDAAQNAGLSRMIVQAPDSEATALQDGLHGVQLALGVITSALLVAISWPYAWGMGTPDVAWAYALIALVPLVRGLGHLDPFRLQRQGRFGPSVVRQLVPQAASLLVIWPAFLLFGDWRTALASIFVQQVAALLASHFGASRPFRLGFDRAVVRRAFAFGWPLAVNGLLMVFVLNGDRMIVSNQFGREALGWFSAAVVLTLTPTLQIARSLQTLMLPVMSRIQDQPQALQRRHDQLTSLVLLLAVGFVAGTAWLGEPLLVAIFGQKFAPAAPYLGILAVMQGIRLLRAVPAISAMARAETRNALYTNIVRGAFIPVAMLIAATTGSLYLMLAAGVVGEGVAAIAAALLARRLTGIAPEHSLVCFLVALLAFLAVGAVALEGVTVWLLLPVAALVLLVARDFLFHAREMVRR